MRDTLIRQTFAVVDLSCIKRNIRAIADYVSPSKVLAVVKANGYGHGIIETAKAALRGGASQLGVELVEEGIALREDGITAPILMLGGVLPEYADYVVEYDLTQTVFDEETVRAINAAALHRRKIMNVHLKVDTGMCRLGVYDEEHLQRMLSCIIRCSNIKLEGVFTHFAKSDSRDFTYNELQRARFESALNTIRDYGFDPIVHASNSGGFLNHRDCNYDMVRPGISMYGYYPSGEAAKQVPLEPALTLCACIIMVKDIPAGERVSYDCTFTARRPMRVATVQIGYGDGYHRLLSSRSKVLIRGRRCDVLGRVCMDHIMVDVSDVPGVAAGDLAVLIGKQEEEFIGADEVAEWAETISYEVLLSISSRVPRIYKGDEDNAE